MQVDDMSRNQFEVPYAMGTPKRSMEGEHPAYNHTPHSSPDQNKVPYVRIPHHQYAAHDSTTSDGLHSPLMRTRMRSSTGSCDPTDGAAAPPIRSGVQMRQRMVL